MCSRRSGVSAQSRCRHASLRSSLGSNHRLSTSTSAQSLWERTHLTWMSTSQASLSGGNSDLLLGHRRASALTNQAAKLATVAHAKVKTQSATARERVRPPFAHARSPLKIDIVGARPLGTLAELVDGLGHASALLAASGSRRQRAPLHDRVQLK